MTMEERLSPGASKALDRFCRQYLQLHTELDYPDSEHLRNVEFQEAIYSKAFKEGSVSYLPPMRYQLRVLKELVKRIEQSIWDWDEKGSSDNIYEAMSALISSSVPSEAASALQKSHVTYSLSGLSNQRQNSPTMTFYESRNVLAAAGTTGLRTWEAALHFGNYLIANPELILGKSILDLGAGTGYLSILCAKYLQASQVLATDRSDEVLSNLQTNMFLNDLQENSAITAKELIWGYPLMGGEELAWNGGNKVDVVLGADLIYNETGFPALCATFGDIFTLFPDVKIIIAATVRKANTFMVFEKTCGTWGYVIEEIEWPRIEKGAQHGPFYDDQVTIKICSITKH